MQEIAIRLLDKVTQIGRIAQIDRKEVLIDKRALLKLNIKLYKSQ